MRRILVCFAVAGGMSLPVHAAESSGCTLTNAGLGATIGGLIGAIVLPGVGFVVGAALGGGGTCVWKQVTAPSPETGPVAARPE